VTPALRRTVLILLPAVALGGLGWLAWRAVAAAPRPDPPVAAQPVEPRPIDAAAPGAEPAAPGPSVVPLGGDNYRIGAIEFDRGRRTIRIPAAVNMVEDAVEYLLVTRTGKVHESVFVTDAAPADLHLAALLLGLRPSEDLGPLDAGMVPPRESAVEAWVEWDRNGPPARVPLHECVALAGPGSSGGLPAGLWLYNGSRLVGGGTFTATRDGSLISIIRDPDALINYPGISRDDDELHRPNAGRLPPPQHPVRVVLRLRTPA